MSEKRIIRVEKTKNFTTLANTAANDERLTFKAVGIHTYLMTKPDNWQVFATHLVTTHRDGRDSVLAGLKELEKYGYLVRRTKRDAAGKITGHESIVYEQPEFTQNENPAANRKIRITEDPYVGKTDANKNLLSKKTEEQQKLTLAPGGALPRMQVGESLADFMARVQGKPKADAPKVTAPQPAPAPKPAKPAKPAKPPKAPKPKKADAPHWGAEIRQPMFDVVAPLLVGSEDPVAIKAAASQISGVVKSLLEVEITTPEETARVGQYIRDQRPSGDDGVIRLQTWRERIPEYLGYRASGKAWPKFGTRTGGKAGHAGTQEEIEARAAQLAKRYEEPAPAASAVLDDEEENLCPAF